MFRCSYHESCVVSIYCKVICYFVYAFYHNHRQDGFDCLFDSMGHMPSIGNKALYLLEIKCSSFGIV